MTQLDLFAQPEPADLSAGHELRIDRNGRRWDVVMIERSIGFGTAHCLDTADGEVPNATDDVRIVERYYGPLRPA